MVPNDGCMVINMLADPNNREYELWEDGESFAIGRSGNHRGVAMRLNITALATYCQMHQYKFSFSFFSPNNKISFFKRDVLIIIE